MGCPVRFVGVTAVLIGVRGDGVTDVVALFEDKDKAHEYVEASLLKRPNGDFPFKERSLLSDYIGCDIVTDMYAHPRWRGNRHHKGWRNGRLV